MKILFKSISKTIKMFHSSDKSIHTIAVLFAGGLWFGYTKMEIILNPENYLDMLNTISLLITFFLLAVDKINFKELTQLYKEKVYVGGLVTQKRRIKEGEYITNTFFSILICELFLITLQYILFIFNYVYVFLLFLSAIYMFLGFLIVVGTWHGRELS